MRDLSPEELEWLEQSPVGSSHGVIGGINLAACDECEWTAQADTFDYLMEQVTTHLEDTYVHATAAQMDIRRTQFASEFGWDPWGEDGHLMEDDGHPHTYDILAVTEKTTDGEVVSETFYSRDMGPDEEDI